jgi:DNA-binding Xre family transcriptional regulator
MTTKEVKTNLVSDDPYIANICSAFGATIARTNDEVLELYATSASRLMWLAPRQSDMSLLNDIVGASRGNHYLLCLEPSRGLFKHYLNAKFSHVIAPDDGLKLLPLEEIAEIIASPESEDFFIGAMVDKENGTAILYRGNLDAITLPLTWLEAEPNSTQPDFDDFEITDFGQTVRLGEYEAGTEAILYEFDPLFRRRDKERRLEMDDSFGGALRRLRLQKGLEQSDFSPEISLKEVGRIERGEVDTIHDSTLESLARRLGVAPEGIETY